MTAVSTNSDRDVRFVDVLGSRLAYVEQGTGTPVIFLHGNPTSSYLWRNVIPHVAPGHRCIALDLIGMGRSDKPALGYGFADHARYVEGAIGALGLRDVVLVLHDWGSALGFDYARRHEHNVRGIAFMEAMLAPVPGWDAFPAELRSMFQAFRTEGVGWDLIARQNIFLEHILPASAVRTLTAPELAAYRAPFPDEASRRPIWKLATQIPIAGEPDDVADVVAGYAAWLRETATPKLLFHASPGATLPSAAVDHAVATIRSLDTVDLGHGTHLLPEDHPDAIGRELAAWLARGCRTQRD